MSRVAPWNRIAAVLLCLLVLVWAGWLWRARKTELDYALEAARRAPMLPMCQWVPVKSPSVVSLGFSTAAPPYWTDSKSAILAFRTSRAPWYVDVGIVAVAGNGITVSSEGGPAQEVPKVTNLARGEVVRLPLFLHTRTSVHSILVTTLRPKPPSGKDQRWLGVAISRIRACDNLAASVPRAAALKPWPTTSPIFSNGKI